jgi:hypothetical protein
MICCNDAERVLDFRFTPYMHQSVRPRESAAHANLLLQLLRPKNIARLAVLRASLQEEEEDVRASAAMTGLQMTSTPANILMDTVE